MIGGDRIDCADMKRLLMCCRATPSSSATVLFAGLLASAACSTPPAPAPAPARSSVTVFEGARLITGNGDAAIENAAFVVDGTHITEVGKAGDVKAPAG